jgi:hypothetical protein
VTPTEINPGEPFQVAFKILNTGTVPMELPVSTDLADLQPGDESAAFSYSSLALVVRAEVEPQRSEAPLGFVELYGSAAHPETVMVLRPGEWIQIRPNVKLDPWPSETVSASFRGEFWLRKNTFIRDQVGSSLRGIISTRTAGPLRPCRSVYLPTVPSYQRSETR